MRQSHFTGLDDQSLLAFFLGQRESESFEKRRGAYLAWSVLCARQVERMRAYIALYCHRHGHAERRAGFDEGVLRTAVERVIASGGSFDGATLATFRAMVRATARRACAEALARGEK